MNAKKKYQELDSNLEKTLNNYTAQAAKLTASKEKALADLSQVKEERARVMESGDLAESRKLKARIIDLTSDVETFTAQLEKLANEQKEALLSLADSIAKEIRKTEDTQHQKDVQEIAKICSDLCQRLEDMESTRAAGAAVIKKAAVSAGIPVPEDISYFSLNSGRRLLGELRKAAQNVSMYNEGKPVHGIENAKNWL